MTGDGERDLRARFSELRDDDRAHVPSFRALMDRAGRNPRARVSVFAWAALAAGIVFIAGVARPKLDDRALTRPVMHSTPIGANAAPSISNWTSPTASLLRTSGRDLLVLSPFLSSILDGAARTAVQPIGAWR